MSIEELKDNLLSDLYKLNLPIDEVDIKMRPYSSSYYGRYFPVRGGETRPKIHIYPYSNKEGDFEDYNVILVTAIHELCHHIQYMDKDFKRVKGVMHNTNFWRLYNHYIKRALKLKIMEDYCETKKN